MARWNQGLLLLAKIENHQFTDNDNQFNDLGKLLADKLKDMEEVMAIRQISVKAENQVPF